MKYAGENTIAAVMDNIKGDMSKITNAIVPTFESVYTSLESMNEDIESLQYEVVSAQEAEAWFN